MRARYGVLAASVAASAAATASGALSAAALASVAAAIAAINLAAAAGVMGSRPYHYVAAVSAVYAVYSAIAGSSPLARTTASVMLLAILAAKPARLNGGQSTSPVPYAVFSSLLASTILGAPEYGFVALMPVIEYMYASSISSGAERLIGAAPLLLSPLMPGGSPLLVAYAAAAYVIKARVVGRPLAAYIVAADASLRPYVVVAGQWITA